MNQNQQILSFMRRTGSISTLDAWTHLQVVSLTRRIRDLRDLGHTIVSERKLHPVTGKRYVRYHLVEAAQSRAVAA